MLISLTAALLSGILLTISFPVVVEAVRLPDLSGVAWVALVPLLLVCRRRSLPVIGLLTFLTGLLYNTLILYWIFIGLSRYGGKSVSTSLAWLLAQSTFWAGMLAIVLATVFWLERRRVFPFLFGFSAGWTLYEWIRNYFPAIGNPWTTLGYSQAGHLPLIQSADLFGVYGLTFLIVLVNLVLVEVADWFILRKTMPSVRRDHFPWIAVLVALLLIQTNFLYGQWRLPHISSWMEQADHMKVGLVQSNIPQEVKFKPKQAEPTRRVLKQLTDQAVAQGAELVIWPEQAIAQVTYSGTLRFSQFSDWDVPVLLGSVTSPLAMATRSTGKRPLQNSAIQIAPGGRTAVIYHKTHLVPFGEYIPFKKVFRFFGIKKKIVPAYGGDFIPGEKGQLLEAGSRRYGVTICYEDLFPEISRAYAANGADFLVNMTNDAWYDDSSAPWQHLTFSRFRAVENRRSMVRSTNTGVTAVIDPAGHIRAQLPIFKEGYLVESVPMGGPNTLYTRYLNAPWLILLGLLVAFGIARERWKIQG